MRTASRELAAVADQLTALPTRRVRNVDELDGGYCRRVRDSRTGDLVDGIALHTTACGADERTPPDYAAGCIEPGVHAPSLLVSGEMAGFTKHPDGRLVSPFGPTIHTRGVGFDCCDCGINTVECGEASYFLHNELWADVMAVRPPAKPNPVGTEMLCVGCCEARLGRELTAADFKPGTGLNDPDHNERSDRLKNRMGPG